MSYDADTRTAISPTSSACTARTTSRRPEGTPRDTARQLNHLYGVRSTLVHGGKKFPTTEELSETRALAYDLCRRGLLRAVHDGFPSAADFNSLILGEV